jgi:transcriptional regulator with PAS, ATPase and Fis domain
MSSRVSIVSPPSDLTEKDTDLAEPSDFSGATRAYLILRNAKGTDVVEVPQPGEGAAIIGRDAAATLRIDDARASRNHARVAWDGAALVLEDLGSRNGTVVNGEVLRGVARPVRGGDCIRIGGGEIAVAVVTPGSTADDKEDSSKRSLSDPPDSSGMWSPGGRAAANAESLEGVVVADPNMARVFGFTRRVAAAKTTALILGETGVGKELVAQQLHRWSDRAARRFIRVNCAALPESLVESELFGHERGAFTGADKRKIGFAEAAHEGTLFLDEIGELSLPVQAKLLAMLENRAVVRVGSTVETPIDVRVIAATHRSLQQEVAEGRFREDLYYRISVVVVRVPPLRERPSEIMLLAKLFAKRFGPQLGWAEPVIAPDASTALVAHGWPGNVRELRNAIEHAMLLTEDGIIRQEHLPETVTSRVPEPGRAPKTGGVRAALAAVERASIEEALRAVDGNRTRAALRLGISLRSLLYKIRKYEIQN